MCERVNWCEVMHMSKNRNVNRVNQSHYGFTLVEVILATAIVALIAGSSIPVGLRFFAIQTLDEHTAVLRSALIAARTKAFYGYNDSNFGVKLFDDRYVVFEGLSYDTRNATEDEVFLIDSSISIAGPIETVFARSTGLPNAPAQYTVSASRIDPVGVRVISNGLIELE